MEKVEEGQAFSVIVDYAHTPDALEYLLNSVKSISGIRRIILVFGCGGDRDRAKRKVMMEIANEKADIVIVTTDNPRSEDPQSIFDDMSHGLPKHWGAQPSANGDYTWFADPSTCVPWENNIIWDKQVPPVLPLPCPPTMRSQSAKKMKQRGIGLWMPLWLPCSGLRALPQISAGMGLRVAGMGVFPHEQGRMGIGAFATFPEG